MYLKHNSFHSTQILMNKQIMNKLIQRKYFFKDFKYSVHVQFKCFTCTLCLTILHVLRVFTIHIISVMEICTSKTILITTKLAVNLLQGATVYINIKPEMVFQWKLRHLESNRPSTLQDIIVKQKESFFLYLHI